MCFINITTLHEILNGVAFMDSSWHHRRLTVVCRCARERPPACTEQVLQLRNVRCHYALMNQRKKKKKERLRRGQEEVREQKGHMEGKNKRRGREGAK